MFGSKKLLFPLPSFYFYASKRNYEHILATYDKERVYLSRFT